MTREELLHEILIIVHSYRYEGYDYPDIEDLPKDHPQLQKAEFLEKVISNLENEIRDMARKADIVPKPIQDQPEMPF